MACFVEAVKAVTKKRGKENGESCREQWAFFYGRIQKPQRNLKTRKKSKPNTKEI